MASAILKISSKNHNIKIELSDIWNFGIDLMISGITILVANIYYNIDIGFIFLGLFVTMIFISVLYVGRKCWDLEAKKLKLRGMLIFDVCGIIILVLSILYVGGVQK